MKQFMNFITLRSKQMKFKKLFLSVHHTVWLDTHENVTKIDQDAAQHPTLSRNIQEHRIWAI